MSYLDELNEAQREAVVFNDGPSLVIAGAGSGKTRVLTYKVMHLLNEGIKPNRILALTFTNKAANEMKERIAAMVGAEKASRLWMGTFHSIFLRLLHIHADLIGFKSNFTIYDTSDSKSLVKMIIKDMELDPKVYKPSAVLAAISNAKNALVDADTYARDDYYRKRDERNGRPDIWRIYHQYDKRCRLSDAMDFDDILFYTNRLLVDREDVRLHYERWFEYILVDEYQDTNLAQHRIIAQLAGKKQRVCVVGDDAQSIYSFRGADITNILSLEKTFPTLHIFKLEQNYRSTQSIVNVAGSLISKNRRQIPKNVFSKKEQGRPVEIIESFSDFEEAYLVVGIINSLRNQYHDSLDDYAVLYRTNAQSRILEEALRKRDIPYRIYGGLAFYQRKEVKDMVSYFRLAVNPDDDEALRRVINYPMRGIGSTTVAKVVAKAIESGTSLWEVISDPQKYPVSVNAGTAKKLAGFVSLIREFQKDVDSGANALDTGKLIFNRTGILVDLAQENTPESVSRRENLESLLSGLSDFVKERDETNSGASLNEYLSEISLATDQDEEDEVDGAKVTLMTVHAAKGLEFRHVIIVGLEKDLFPSQMAQTPYEYEEERRLLYVAITRAKDTCHITFAGSRMRNGQVTASTPSPFLSDLDPHWVKTQSNLKKAKEPAFTPSPHAGLDKLKEEMEFFNPRAPKIQNIPQEPTFSDNMVTHDMSELNPGMEILHSRFGKGTILKCLEGDIIEVDFPTVGHKKLMLKYARFEIL